MADPPLRKFLFCIGLLPGSYICLGLQLILRILRAYTEFHFDLLIEGIVSIALTLLILAAIIATVLQVSLLSKIYCMISAIPAIVEIIFLIIAELNTEEPILGDYLS